MIRRVYLVCPSCGRKEYAIVDSESFWGAGVKDATIALQVHCRCGQRPPMQVVIGTDCGQGELFR